MKKSLTEKEKEGLEQFKGALQSLLGDNLLSLRLFGSRARGETNDPCRFARPRAATDGGLYHALTHRVRPIRPARCGTDAVAPARIQRHQGGRQSPRIDP